MQRWRAGSRFLPLGKPTPRPAPSGARASSAPVEEKREVIDPFRGLLSEGWLACRRPCLQSPNIGSIVVVAAVVRSSATILWPAGVVTVTNRFELPRRSSVEAQHSAVVSPKRLLVAIEPSTVPSPGSGARPNCGTPLAQQSKCLSYGFARSCVCNAGCTVTLKR